MKQFTHKNFCNWLRTLHPRTRLEPGRMAEKFFKARGLEMQAGSPAWYDDLLDHLDIEVRDKYVNASKVLRFAIACSPYLKQTVA